MKVSGKDVAEAILKKLQQKIKKENLRPSLAIILAGGSPASRIYVKNKLNSAQRIGIDAKLFEFSRNEKDKIFKTIQKLNADKSTNGIIVQYPVYDGWNFDDFAQIIDPLKDVDGFLENSPYVGATAMAVWEMIFAFAKHEGFKKCEEFLKDKKIVILGKGKTAGKPTINLLKEKGFEVTIVDSKTENRDEVIKKGDVVISATGIKHIVNGSNIKNGAYVIGVGVGKEAVDGQTKIYGDIEEESVSKIAKLYCPTVGGIGPLTVACLLRNVVESSKRRN